MCLLKRQTGVLSNSRKKTGSLKLTMSALDEYENIIQRLVEELGCNQVSEVLQTQYGITRVRASTSSIYKFCLQWNIHQHHDSLLGGDVLMLL